MPARPGDWRQNMKAGDIIYETTLGVFSAESESAKFSYQAVACYQHKFRDGDKIRFDITETLNDYHGAPPKYQAVCTSIVRRSLDECLAALKASCEAEDAKTPEQIADEMAVSDAADQAYYSACCWVSGERD